MRVFGAILAMAAVLGMSAGVQAQDEMPADTPANGKSAPRPAQTPLSSPAVPGKGDAAKPSVTADEPPGIAPPGTMIDQPIAVLQALDKISARVRRLTVKVGQAAPFGTLSITVDACRKAPPEDPPESAAFLKITDTKPGEASQTVFSGWMFASSPALSAMDHPVYDIWVVDCSSDPTASATPAQ